MGTIRAPSKAHIELTFELLALLLGNAIADDADDVDDLPAFAPPLRRDIGLCIFSASFARVFAVWILDQACRSCLARAEESKRGDGKGCRAGRRNCEKERVEEEKNSLSGRDSLALSQPRDLERPPFPLVISPSPPDDSLLSFRFSQKDRYANGEARIDEINEVPKQDDFPFFFFPPSLVDLDPPRL